MSGASVKHTSEQIAEAVGAVLHALKSPKSGQLVTAEETGVDSAFLLDLYMTGYLWIARRDTGIVFGVTRAGREVWAKSMVPKQATATQEKKP